MGACCTKPARQAPCQSAPGGREIARQGREGAESIAGADAKLENKLKKYTELGYLVGVLRTGAVRLVKAEYIVHQYLNTSDPMPCCQDLPEEAFLHIEDLTEKELTQLSIFVLSYCWITADHPDPDRYHLTDVARILNMYLLSDPRFDDPDPPVKTGREHGWDYGGKGRPVAVFWDWCSLPQDKPKGRRTAEESEVFEQGLKSVNSWYGHALTTVLMLTTLPAEAARSSYNDSGWTSFERAVASILTPGPRSLVVGEEARAELDRCAPASRYDDQHVDLPEGLAYSNYNQKFMDKMRGAPCAPEAFSALIRGKHVTNGADIDKVLIPKYQQTFQEVIGTGTISLCYCGLTSFGAHETLRVAKIHCPHLRQLSLAGNGRVDVDLAEVAASCKHLVRLDLSQCGAVTGDLSSLSEEKDLEVVNLYRTKVEGYLSSLESLERLQMLNLLATRVGGGIASLAGLKQLRELNLYNTCCEGDLSDLGGLQELTVLSLGTDRRPLISGKVSSLAGLKQLRYLDLEGQKVKNDLAGPWGRVPLHLQTLDGCDDEEARGFLGAPRLAGAEEVAARWRWRLWVWRGSRASSAA